MMKLTQIQVKNFRLLQDVSVRTNRDGLATILVGPNNSGKTSVAEALLLFVAGGKKGFSAYDFSMLCREKFAAAEKLILEEKDDAEATKDLPSMALDLYFEYGDDGADLAVASDLLMDLNEASNTVRLRIEFAAIDGVLLARGFREARRAGDTLFDYLLANLGTAYAVSYYKVAPLGQEVEKLENGAVLDRLLKVDFVFAQRHIDDQENSRATRLSHLLYAQYEKHHKSAEPQNHEEIERTLAAHAKDLGSKYMTAFGGLIESLKRFGYPQKRAPSMSIRAELNASTLFKENTRIFYGPFQAVQPGPAAGAAAAPVEGAAAAPAKPGEAAAVEKAIAGAVAVAADAAKDGAPADATAIEHQLSLELPEKYNGLGFKNLIYMILQIQSFRTTLERMTVDRPRVHVIFIEEPETHLHPQVQSVFIKQISNFLKDADKGSNAQIIITTHSSHIIADSGFTPIRHFRRRENQVSVKDLLQFEDGIKKTAKKDAADPVRFLTKYMSLTHCDLFFADKAILIEGQVERLLLPTMIVACAAKGRPDFGSEYITMMEVGGAYAHMFEALLKFIEIPTLIITDLDSVGADGKKCPVAAGVNTSNATLKGWLPKKTALADLHGATAANRQDGTIRVAYQCPEKAGGPCARSFEEAFVYANVDWLIANGANLFTTGNKFKKPKADDLIAAAYELDLPKVDFALDLLVSNGWQAPRYIREGLEWLADYGAAP
jgi:putative ATP-dependent endonuclease of the OLD family